MLATGGNAVHRTDRRAGEGYPSLTKIPRPTCAPDHAIRKPPYGLPILPRRASIVSSTSTVRASHEHPPSRRTRRRRKLDPRASGFPIHHQVLHPVVSVLVADRETTVECVQCLTNRVTKKT